MTSAHPSLANPMARGLQVIVIAVCGLGFAIDLMEMALGGVLSTVFSAPPYRLAGAELSTLVAAAYIGAIAGAPLLAWLSDRVGLRRTLAVTLIAMGVGSLLSGISPTPRALTIARAATGVALGAYPPLMIAYLSQVMPPWNRARSIFLACAIAYLAPPAAIFCVRALTPTAPLGVEGWRWPLLAAGLVAAAAATAFLRLPEAQHPDRPRLAPRERPAPIRASRLVTATVLYALIPWATVAFPLAAGPILLARHFSLSDTLFLLGLATFGPIVGTALMGFTADGFGRRTFLAAAAVGMLISILVFFSAAGPGMTATGLIGFGLFGAVYMPAMTTYGAELFAPRVRARATGYAWMANRVSAALAPLLLLPMTRAGSLWPLAAVLCLSLGLSLLWLWRKAPAVGRPGLAT